MIVTRARNQTMGKNTGYVQRAKQKLAPIIYNMLKTLLHNVGMFWMRITQFIFASVLQSRDDETSMLNLYVC